MMTGIMDYTPLLRASIAEAKAAGFETAARDLEQSCFAVALHHVNGNARGAWPRHQALPKGYTRYLATLNQGETKRLSDRDGAGVTWLAKTTGTSGTASCA